LIVTNSATLTIQSDLSAEGFKGVLIHAQNIQIDPTSRISADATGYAIGPGTGDDFGGGGYGGEGGSGWGYSCYPGCGDGGSTYGSALHPTDLGSGRFDRGGGAIRLIVSDLLTVDGILSSNGTSIHGCGASGGSIYVTTHRIAGSGDMFADGGTAHAPDNYNGWGSGGGGRIAVYYDTSTYTGKAEAKGGAAIPSYWGSAGPGKDGTVSSSIPPITSSTPDPPFASRKTMPHSLIHR